MSTQRILTVLAGLLVLKVTTSVVQGYDDYLPPNFAADFLRGRQSYFWGTYQWAFYAHIVAGPITLILGLALMSERFRLRFPAWHRRLGKTQIMLVLLFLAPSGFWMAFYTLAGPWAATGFAALAIATAMCALLGWTAAMAKRFAEHRRWMWRCYLLLCSAVTIRVIGGTATVMNLEADWIYPAAAWASWLLPIAIYELMLLLERRFRLPNDPVYSSPLSDTSSLPAIEISARRTFPGIPS
jgi:hypothetical protein